MFDERRKDQLEKQVRNLAKDALFSLRMEQSMEIRRSMMAILRTLDREFNSVKMYGDKNVSKVVRMGFDDRKKKMILDLINALSEVIDSMENKKPFDLTKMHKIDSTLEDMRNGWI